MLVRVLLWGAVGVLFGVLFGVGARTFVWCGAGAVGGTWPGAKQFGVLVQVLLEVVMTRVLGGMQFGVLVQVLFWGRWCRYSQTLVTVGLGGMGVLAGCLLQEALDQILPFFKVSLRPAPNFKHLCWPQKWSKQKHLRFSDFQFHIRKPLNSAHRSVPEVSMIWPTSSVQSSTCFVLFGIYAGVI